jgi:hypothetical protein
MPTLERTASHNEVDLGPILFNIVVDLHCFQCGSGASFSTSMWIRIQGAKSMRIHADPGPCQNLPSKEVEFLHEKYTLCK